MNTGGINKLAINLKRKKKKKKKKKKQKKKLEPAM